MPTPFPGMDPYLERPSLWQDFHSRLIVALADYLAPRVRPRYYVGVEERTYRAGITGLTFVGRPDVTVVASPKPAYAVAPTVETAIAGIVPVELPVPDIVRETYLEVRASGADGDRVITALEILSPGNKLPGEGRTQYENKRMVVLGSLTHLVEIDLLRGGLPMLMFGDGRGAPYRILVSRAAARPQADLLPFSVRQPIPDFPLPLRRRDEELAVPLNTLLHELYDRAGYDLRINYRADPIPPLGGEDAAWAEALLREKGLR
ncbi:MAG: hypothetical protein CVU38_10280 [Chloroflexi bacterium HGW-Chloroflexi-1]|nr:MAG: hypothetical protein CVU38_10280 [Chloroflexi bacterium HGW-Chloroflexi-1]